MGASMNRIAMPKNLEEIYHNHLYDFEVENIDINRFDTSRPFFIRTGFMVDYDENGYDDFFVSRGRIHLRKGFVYLNKVTNEQCELIEYVNETSQVVVRSLDDNKTSLVNINQLDNIVDENNTHINVDISLIGDEAWETAQHRFEVIKPLIGSEVYGNHRTQMLKRSQESNVPINTLYRWLRNYRSMGSIAGLVDRKRGWVEGNTRLRPEQETIIERAINSFYLTKQRATLEQTYREVQRLCRLQEIEAPSKKAIRLRINKLSEKEKLKKRGQKKLADKKFNATPHEYPPTSYPLEVVQIDHTKVDLMLVDSENRQPIGRPWLTLAIDVYSRMVTGYYLSLDAPSVTSVAMCVARSILPKNQLLLEHDITDANWQVYGYPTKVHTDNGADFRSATFAKSCEIHGINIEYRPVGKPHFGSHIERLMGTFMKEIHGLKGTTFSNIKEKDDYDSEKESVMTFDEFEEWLLIYITKYYHQKEHSGLGISPSQQWDIGIYGDENSLGVGLPAMPVDERTLLLDFLPIFYRTIQHFGVTIDGLKYYDSCLNPYINAKDEHGNNRNFVFRRDPRDISYLWFYDEHLHQYFKVPFSNKKLEPMSIWEYREVRKYIESKGDKYVNEHQIFEALDQMRDIVEKSAKSTKSARRQQERNKNHRKGQTVIARTLAANKEAGIENQNSINLVKDDISLNSSNANFQNLNSININPVATTINIGNSYKNNELLDDDADFDFGDID